VKSAGNDIVALNAIDIQRTTTPAFYSKFIVAEESALYSHPQFANIPFQNFVWLLWSVKESAYKYLKRLQTDLIFSPSKIVIQNISLPEIHSNSNAAAAIWESDNTNEDFYTGAVIFKTNHLYFRSKITGEFIASAVNDGPQFCGVYWGIKIIEQAGHENQSAEVRELTLKKLISIRAGSNLRIEKSAAGYPVVLDDAEQIDIPISFAHHDRFVGYSFFLQ
jgi:phosphopantetheinyl transferase (holo-ACP synthase)